MSSVRVFIVFIGVAAIICSAYKGPIFNRNYVYSTHSCNGQFVLNCVPVNCTNESGGCIKISQISTQRVALQFFVRDITGCVYIVSNNGQIVIEIPAYQGFGLFSYDFRTKSSTEIEKQNQYVKKYVNAKLVDSLLIPSMLLTKQNFRLLMTKGKMDVRKVILLKDDSVQIVTCRNKVTFSIANMKGKTTNDFASKNNGFRKLQYRTNNKCTYDIKNGY